MNTTETKICSQCNEPKVLTQFRPTGKKWRVSRCRQCEMNGRICSCGNKITNTSRTCGTCQRRLRIAKTGVVPAASLSAWISRNLGRLGKFRKRHIEVTVTHDDLIAIWNRQNGCCAITGIEMSTRPRDLCNGSVDRIDAAGHYTPDNVMFTCKWVNLGRGQSSIYDFAVALTRINSFVVGATVGVGAGGPPGGK